MLFWCRESGIQGGRLRKKHGGLTGGVMAKDRGGNRKVRARQRLGFKETPVQETATDDHGWGAKQRRKEKSLHYRP